jgi:hypothetical protein
MGALVGVAHELRPEDDKAVLTRIADAIENDAVGIVRSQTSPELL